MSLRRLQSSKSPHQLADARERVGRVAAQHRGRRRAAPAGVRTPSVLRGRGRRDWSRGHCVMRV